MKNKRPLFFTIFFLVSGIAIFLFAKPKAEDMKYAGFSEVKAAPEFTLKDVNGNTVKLSDFRGKVVVLNFWATWCAPCKRELPDLVALSREMADRNVKFIGVSTDRGPNIIEDVRAFVNEHGIP